MFRSSLEESVTEALSIMTFFYLVLSILFPREFRDSSSSRRVPYDGPNVDVAASNRKAWSSGGLGGLLAEIARRSHHINPEM